jgi:prefoldin subunit 5
VIKKDLELETLKEELRLLRRQLSERNAELDALRKKGKTSPKSSETLP